MGILPVVQQNADPEIPADVPSTGGRFFPAEMVGHARQGHLREEDDIGVMFCGGTRRSV